MLVSGDSYCLLLCWTQCKNHSDMVNCGFVSWGQWSGGGSLSACVYGFVVEFYTLRLCSVDLLFFLCSRFSKVGKFYSNSTQAISTFKTSRYSVFITHSNVYFFSLLKCYHNDVWLNSWEGIGWNSFLRLCLRITALCSWFVLIRTRGHVVSF